MILELGICWALAKDWKDDILTYGEVCRDKGRIDNLHSLVGCEVVKEGSRNKIKGVIFLDGVVEFSIGEVCSGVN